MSLMVKFNMADTDLNQGGKYEEQYRLLIGWRDGSDDVGVRGAKPNSHTVAELMSDIAPTEIGEDGFPALGRITNVEVWDIAIPSDAFAVLYEKTMAAGKILDLTPKGQKELVKQYKKHEGPFAGL